MRRAHTQLTAMFCGLGLTLNAIAGEVTLTGQGAVTYQPDSVRMELTATGEHTEADEATDRMKSQVQQWRSLIDDYEDELQELDDTTISIYTRRQPSPARQSEMPETVTVARQTLRFSLSDLSLLNTVLDDARTAKLEYRLGPDSFFHSKADELSKQALAAAIADAKSRCEFVADQLDKSCGDVITLQISDGHRPVPMMSAMRTAESTVENIGQRKIEATVTATFEID